MIDCLSPAGRRAALLLAQRSRRRTRGVTVFVVITTLALLAAVGLFAARSAAQTDMAVGDNRRAVQTYYLAELAGRTTLAEFGMSSGELYLEAMQEAPDVCAIYRGDQSEIEKDLGADVTRYPCYKVFDQELEERTISRSGARLLAAQGTAPGSLGPALAGLDSTDFIFAAQEGVFVVELSDAVQGELLPGYTAQNQGAVYRSVQFTLTAFAQVRLSPEDGSTPAAGRWCTAAARSAAASIASMRGQFTVPVASR